MSLKSFSFLLLLFISTFRTLAARESLVSEEVYLRINECIQATRYTSAKWSDTERAALREKAFAGLNDREKIRALAEWMFRKQPPTHSESASAAGSLLIAPEPVIEDFTELRRLMADETDSRRFFQLFVLAPAYDRKNHHDFMVDRARGLFMEGVAADRGQSTTDHPLDCISSYSFSYITQRLRDNNQDFKDKVYPALLKLDFTERNLALARWLKANWSGCEDLQLPAAGRDQKQRVSGGPDTEAVKRSDGRAEGGESLPQARSFRWFWPGALFVLAAAIFGWIKLRRR